MRYPIVSIDYARSRRLLETAESLLMRSKLALEDLKLLKKECSKIDSVSEEFDADFDEFLAGEHELIALSVGDELESQIAPLEDAINRYGEAVKRLRPIADQAEAWDKHFRKEWQAIFQEAFDEKITKEQTDESFLEAAEWVAADDAEWGEWEGSAKARKVVKRTPGTRIEWVDSGGMLKIDLEKAFEGQQLFEPDEDEETEEEMELEDS